MTVLLTLALEDDDEVSETLKVILEEKDIDASFVLDRRL